MKILKRTFIVVLALGALAFGMLFLYPRPADTTDPSIFAGDSTLVDYCELAQLDGSGLLASEIPKAYTPGCGFEKWPMPVLAECTEPLAAGVKDIRGLWRSITPEVRHFELVEQCGNRAIVVSAGLIHDFITDGTIANGARDINRSGCYNISAAISWQDGVMNFRPLGLPYIIVSRELQGDQLVWDYPGIGEVRMERVCSLAEAG